MCSKRSGRSELEAYSGEVSKYSRRESSESSSQESRQLEPPFIRVRDDEAALRYLLNCEGISASVKVDNKGIFKGSLMVHARDGEDVKHLMKFLKKEHSKVDGCWVRLKPPRGNSNQ